MKFFNKNKVEALVKRLQELDIKESAFVNNKQEDHDWSKLEADFAELDKEILKLSFSEDKYFDELYYS